MSIMRLVSVSVRSLTWRIARLASSVMPALFTTRVRVRSTSLTASRVSARMAVTMPPIFCVASPVRAASWRTSSATTAKPRPCSPARAASMAAFSASRLVWSAMSLITLRMVLTSSERRPRPAIRSFSAFMVRVTLAMSLPTRATVAALLSVSWPVSRAIRSACWAVSAMCCTLTVTSSTPAAVALAASDCCCEAVLTSWAEPASAAAERDTASLWLRTSRNISRRLAMKRLNASAVRPISSRLATSIRAVRSPWPVASASMVSARVVSGRVR